MYFAAGDRTSNDRLIKKVNDSLLENPVRTYGGPEYMDQIKIKVQSFRLILKEYIILI
jgi:hypothetical protein